MSYCANYLSQLTPARFSATVRRLAQKITEEFPTCNMVAGKGLSGCMILPALAARLKIEWAICRKKDASHSSLAVEISNLPEGGARIVIVDDLICSGKTVRSIVKAAKERLTDVTGEPHEFIGGLLYDERSSDNVDGIKFFGVRK